MRRDRGKAGPQKGRERKPPTEYVIGTDSDLGYARASRQRVRQRTQRKWVIRLAILAVLGFVVYLWGDDVWYAVRSRARTNAQKFQDSADYLKKGRDERGGANFDENAPDWRRPSDPGSGVE